MKVAFFLFLLLLSSFSRTGELRAELTREEQLLRAQERGMFTTAGCKWKPTAADFIIHPWLAVYVAAGGYIWVCKWYNCYFYEEVVSYRLEYERVSAEGLEFQIPILFIEVYPKGSYLYDCYKFPDIVFGSCETPNKCESMPHWAGG